MAKKTAPSKSSNMKEDHLLLIKPASKRFGLDYLHITLIVLVVILVALAFALTTFKVGTLTVPCQYGLATNGTCAAPQHTSSQVLASAEKYLAAYSTVNSSLSLLPFYSEPNNASVTYLSNSSTWLVQVPYLDPQALSQKFYFSMVLSDKTLLLQKSYVQTINPLSTTNNQAVALGTVSLAGKVTCAASAPIPVYPIIDIYAPGGVAAISSAINASQKYGHALNMSYKFIVSGFAEGKYSGYGVNQTVNTMGSLLCASTQPKFPAFFKNFSIVFIGNPLSNDTLGQVASGSGLNMTQYISCLKNSSIAVNRD